MPRSSAAQPAELCSHAPARHGRAAACGQRDPEPCPGHESGHICFPAPWRDLPGRHFTSHTAAPSLTASRICPLPSAPALQAAQNTAVQARRASGAAPARLRWSRCRRAAMQFPDVPANQCAVMYCQGFMTEPGMPGMLQYCRAAAPAMLAVGLKPSTWWWIAEGSRLHAILLAQRRRQAVFKIQDKPVILKFYLNVLPLKLQ